MIWRWVRRLLVVALLVAGVVLARYTLFKPQIVPVTVFRVGRGTVEETVTNSKAGSIKSRRHASLSPEMGGRVEMLAVREGQRVKQGDVLMRLVADEYRAQVHAQRPVRQFERIGRRSGEGDGQLGPLVQAAAGAARPLGGRLPAAALPPHTQRDAVARQREPRRVEIHGMEADGGAGAQAVLPELPQPRDGP